MGLWDKVKTALSRKEPAQSRWQPSQGVGDDGGDSPTRAAGSPD